MVEVEPPAPIAMAKVATAGSLPTISPSALLPAHHLRERDVLRRFRDAGDEAGVLLREEALGDDDEQIACRGQGREEDAQRHEAGGAARRRGRARSRAAAVEAALGQAVEAAVPALAARCAGSARPSSASGSARRRPRRAMVMVTVTANSRNRRPTMPPISSSGMNTATSEMLIERMVKPISPAPLIAASQRLHARPRCGARCSPA